MSARPCSYPLRREKIHLFDTSFTRALVSSLAITSLPRTVAAICSAAAPNGFRPRRRGSAQAVGSDARVAPNATDFALLVDPSNPNNEPLSNDMRAAARTLGLNIHILPATGEGDFAGVFESAIRLGAAGLIIGPNTFGLSAAANRQLALLAARHALPTIFDDTGARHQAANGFCTQIAIATSPGLAPPNRRAAATSSNCCAPATAITSSMPRLWPICATAPSPAR